MYILCSRDNAKVQTMVHWLGIFDKYIKRSGFYENARNRIFFYPYIICRMSLLNKVAPPVNAKHIIEYIKFTKVSRRLIGWEGIVDIFTVVIINTKKDVNIEMPM